jgi:hypothetical protein
MLSETKIRTRNITVNLLSNMVACHARKSTRKNGRTAQAYWVSAYFSGYYKSKTPTNAGIKCIIYYECKIVDYSSYIYK